MRIAIDGNEANVQNLVGVSVYTVKLLGYFQTKASAEVQFTIYLRKDPLPHLPKETDFFRYEVIPGPFLWSRIFLPLHLMTQGNFDVFFAPAHYSPHGLNKPLVVTIHDLSYFYYPNEFLKKDLFKLRDWTQESLEKAQAVIAVSKTTKKDILKYYKTPDSKIAVVYNGFEKPEKKASEQEVLKTYGLEKKRYFLYVGTIQPRKNISTLIKAFKVLKQNHPEYKLVIVGKKGWLYDDILNQVGETDNDSILFTGFLPDNDVVQLYKHAHCFVQPSFYEGFGIPILEAMSYDCPVIASLNASLPEVGGDACLYFDPDEEKELVEKMELIITQPQIRKELVAKGKKRITAFSWEQCADQTLEVIKKAAQ